MFFENQKWSADTIKNQNAIYGPLDPDALGNEVAVDDVARATASVIAHPEKHKNMKYIVTGPELISYDDYAKVFSEILGKQVKYVQLPYDEVEKTLIKDGTPKQYATALLQLMKMRDKNPPNNTYVSTLHYLSIYCYYDYHDCVQLSALTIDAAVSDDFEKLTGRKGIKFREWLKQHKDFFV